jgi:3'(2'), 5'-bisphosphate nucleotidase
VSNRKTDGAAVSPSDLSDDHQLAARIAERAGALLLELRDRGSDDNLGAEGDRRSHDTIIGLLRQQRPKDAVLSEEGRSGEDQGGGARGERRVWIVDPLDGTREFSEGRNDFAVHVALVRHGRVAAGAVALPGEHLLLATDQPPSLAARRPGRRRLVVSRTRPPAQVSELSRRLDAEVVSMGSAGAKSMAVVRGEADVYLHDGGQYEWDSAAPVAVAQAAGAHCSRIDGAPLLYDRPDPYLPDLLVCRPELAEEVLLALRGSP